MSDTESISLNGITRQSFPVQIETYNAKLKELKELMKNLRKEGKDTYIAEICLYSFPAKMHIAEITREQKDLDVLKDMLERAEKELKDAMNETIVDVRKEVEQGAQKLIEEDIKKQQQT